MVFDLILCVFILNKKENNHKAKQFVLVSDILHHLNIHV